MPLERISRVVAKRRTRRGAVERMTEQPESPADGSRQQRDLVARMFERFRVPLLRYLTDLLSRRDEAEDLVQETYLRLMQVETIETGRVRALIFKVATNLAYDRFRQRRARGPHGDDAALADLPAHEPAPERIVAFEQGVEIVKRTLLELKPRCRQVFLLRASAELGYEEIARRLGISKRTARSETNERRANSAQRRARNRCRVVRRDRRARARRRDGRAPDRVARPRRGARARARALLGRGRDRARSRGRPGARLGVRRGHRARAGRRARPAGAVPSKVDRGGRGRRARGRRDDLARARRASAGAHGRPRGHSEHT